LSNRGSCYMTVTCTSKTDSHPPLVIHRTHELHHPGLATAYFVMADKILIHCWVFGENPERVFPVRIEGNKTVCELRDMIKTNQFTYGPANTLTLRRISVVEDDLNAQLGSIDLGYLNTLDRLQPTRQLSRVFSGQPADGHLYIIVVSDGEC